MTAAYAFDPAFDIWINPPSPVTRTGAPLHEFSATEDAELVVACDVICRTAAISPRLPLLVETYPGVKPTPEQLGLLDAAVRRAADCGLDLPILLVRFTVAERNAQNGDAFDVFGDGRLVRITLHAGEPLEYLKGLVLHECMHASDMHAQVFADMDVAQRERRAVAFALNASEAWTL